MKTMTMTLDATPGVDVPDAPAGEPAYGDGVGFRVTITTPSGAQATPPVENKLVWTFGNMIEGATYGVKVEVVDGAGRAIQTIETSAVVPAKSTFTQVNGIGFAFA
jgi:hypothetical protein